jgi:hypothetical protein
MPATTTQRKPRNNPSKQRKQTNADKNQSLKRNQKSKMAQTTLIQYMKLRPVTTNKTHTPENTDSDRDCKQKHNPNKTTTLCSNYDIGNNTFGNDIQPDTGEIFYFHNINSIKSDDNWAQILQTLTEHNVTCFGIAETNISFAHPTAKEHLKKIRQTFKHSRLSTSERESNKAASYKPGGTLTAIVGKWQA